jgi:hypothetical protein
MDPTLHQELRIDTATGIRAKCGSTRLIETSTMVVEDAPTAVSAISLASVSARLSAASVFPQPPAVGTMSEHSRADDHRDMQLLFAPQSQTQVAASSPSPPVVSGSLPSPSIEPLSAGAVIDIKLIIYPKQNNF